MPGIVLPQPHQEGPLPPFHRPARRAGLGAGGQDELGSEELGLSPQAGAGRCRQPGDRRHPQDVGGIHPNKESPGLELVPWGTELLIPAFITTQGH